MLFIVPGQRDTLRVNGRVQIVTDAPYLPRLTMRDVVPRLAIEVRVEELYLHCGKAFARSSRWDPSTWHEKGAGQMARGQLGVTTPAQEIDAALQESERVNRY